MADYSYYKIVLQILRSSGDGWTRRGVPTKRSTMSRYPVESALSMEKKGDRFIFSWSARAARALRAARAGGGAQPASMPASSRSNRTWGWRVGRGQGDHLLSRWRGTVF